MIFTWVDIFTAAGIGFILGGILVFRTVMQYIDEYVSEAFDDFWPETDYEAFLAPYTEKGNIHEVTQVRQPIVFPPTAGGTDRAGDRLECDQQFLHELGLSVRGCGCSACRSARDARGPGAEERRQGSGYTGAARAGLRTVREGGVEVTPGANSVTYITGARRHPGIGF